MAKNITALEPGTYLVEFVREERRTSAQANGTASRDGAGTDRTSMALSACILRVVATGDEVEDTSRSTAGTAPGTRFNATVEEGVRYAVLRPLLAEVTA